MIGTRIGPFEIGESLGSGGIGDVYAAVDTTLGREVAIKVLRPQFSRNDAFVERFQREAMLLARLHHPNITTLFALHRQGDLLLMVMELVCGLTLDTLISQARRLNFPTSRALMAQAVEGLSYAHGKGVIHRDVKPSNLIITREGVLKLMDFGVARLRGSSRLTRHGSLIGTVAYMAPEQAKGEEGDERSDEYGLATVLYEMLSGRLPFHQAGSDAELVRAQLEWTAQPLIGTVPDLDQQIDAAIQRALAKAPEERFPTVQAFGVALGMPAMAAGASAQAARQLGHLFRAVEPPLTRLGLPNRVHEGQHLLSAVSPAGPSQRWPRRLRRSVIAAVTVVMVLWFGMRSLDRSSPDTSSPMTESRSVMPTGTPSSTAAATSFLPEGAVVAHGTAERTALQAPAEAAATVTDTLAASGPAGFASLSKPIPPTGPAASALPGLADMPALPPNAPDAPVRSTSLIPSIVEPVVSPSRVLQPPAIASVTPLTSEQDGTRDITHSPAGIPVDPPPIATKPAAHPVMPSHSGGVSGWKIIRH